MEFPTFKLVIDDNDDTGIHEVALVDRPAIMVDWMKFSAHKEEVKLEIQSEEQRIIFGPALIPDLPIYRQTEDGQEFYVVMDAPTIQQMAIKFARENRMNEVNTMHQTGNIIPNITIFESFITNENRAVGSKNYESLPIGTLFFTAKVNDDATWQKIKSGELKGYSVEGMFDRQPFKELDQQQIEAVIEYILNQ